MRTPIVLLTAILLLPGVAGCGGGPGTPARSASPGTSSGSSARASASTGASASSRPAATASGGAGGYLALGDSVAFGYRPPAVTPVTSYLNPANFTGYPEDAARRLKLTLVNASCPGETTSSMINMNGPSNGCERGAHGGTGYRDLAPLHVRYQGSQLSFAVSYLTRHRATRLVTLTIGANDLFRCQSVTTDRCTGTDFTTTLATVRRNVAEILGALRHRAGYRGTIVLVSYYALNYAKTSSVGRVRALNAALLAAAAGFRVRVADGFAAFRRASAAHDGNGCAAGLLVRLPSGDCGEHPSAAGQRLLADVVTSAYDAARR